MVYGFHPSEPLAEEIGENLAEREQEGIEVIRFRPSSIPEDLRELAEEEGTLIEERGRRELKRHIREAYNGVGLVVDIHETPVFPVPNDWDKRHPQFEIYFPAWNQDLKRALDRFAEEYPKNVWIVGHRPDIYSTYHSLTIEYFSKIRRGNEILTLTKAEGQEFAKDLINYLMKNYLGKS